MRTILGLVSVALAPAGVVAARDATADGLCYFASFGGIGLLLLGCLVLSLESNPIVSASVDLPPSPDATDAEFTRVVSQLMMLEGVLLRLRGSAMLYLHERGE